MTADAERVHIIQTPHSYIYSHLIDGMIYGYVNVTFSFMLSSTHIHARFSIIRRRTTFRLTEKFTVIKKSRLCSLIQTAIP